MGKIFCILGKSSCGKDTVFKELINDLSLGLLGVVTYTTRPRRENENDGVEYHFFDEEKLSEFKAAGQIIELRNYNTIKGIWTYCTIDDGFINLKSGNYLMIVTLEAFKSLGEYFGRNAIVPICLMVEDGLRLTRALEREKNQLRPDYEELCRRFIADNVDFSTAHLKNCGITQFFNNENLKSCIVQISDMIKKEL